MFGIFSRGRKIPPDYNYLLPSDVSTLHGAKLAAWAIVIGDVRPSAEPRHARRHHGGMSDDLPLPEPAPRRPRPLLRAIVEALGRFTGSGRRQPACAAALSGLLPEPVGESVAMTYIDCSDGRESGRRAPAQAARESTNSRAA